MSIPLQVDRSSLVPLKRQIYLSLRARIVDGTLSPGAKLPSSRELSKDHGISRSTVVEVYEQLLAEGLAGGAAGSGTFVSRNLGTIGAEREKKSRPHAEPLRLSARGESFARARVTAGDGKRIVGAFRNGLPAIDLFPREAWARHLARAARSAGPESFDYVDASGYLPLREAIAERIGLTRAVRCVAEQVIVVDGTQQALDLIAQVLVRPGDGVCVEDPGYLGLRAAFAAAGAALRPVAVDQDGMDVASGKREWARPKIICVSPSHQYPMGVSLSMPRRIALLAWARKSNAAIVEDDFENEFRYSNAPITSLHSLDTDDRVFYLGSFSKTMAPSLRVGYLVVPERYADVFHAAKRVTGRACKALEQAALAAFLTDGTFARHVHRMRDVYEERQRTLVHEVRRRAGGAVEIQPAVCGIHVLARLNGVDDRALSSMLATEGIDAAALSPLAIRPLSRGGLLLGYAVASPKQIRSGVAVLERCLDRLLRGNRVANTKR